MNNSEIVLRVMNTLLTIAGRKTTKGYAIIAMETLVQELAQTYDFLKFIQINDNRFTEGGHPVTIMSQMDEIPSEDIGEALQALLVNLNRKLGNDAGHFFFREISRQVGHNYMTTMKDMGVDLNLLQLETEVRDLEKRLLKEE